MSSPELPYQPFYCEENVFQLCAHPALRGRSPAALFIRGLGPTCVIWHQRATAPDDPTFWDYHVVLLARDPWEIWDLDTRLGCPVAATTYLRRSFRPELALRAEFTPRFRLVEATALARTFASDRSHMRGPDGLYREPPPPWPPIGGEGAPSTLARFLDLRDPIAGELLDLPALLTRTA